MQHKTLGALYIVGGALLFFLAAGEWLFRLGLTVLAWKLINHGLSLRGLPTLTLYATRFFGNVRYYR